MNYQYLYEEAKREILLMAVHPIVRPQVSRVIAHLEDLEADVANHHSHGTLHDTVDYSDLVLPYSPI